MSRPDLAVEIAGITLKNPVMTASGTFGSGQEYHDFIDLNKLGAIVTKTITFQPRLGNPTPRICETPSGMLNAIGLQNNGVEAFVANDLPWLAQFDLPVIVSIGGDDLDEYCRVTKFISQVSGVAALEINISCPNVKLGGMSFGQDARVAADLVSKVRTCSTLPLIVKLTPNVGDIVAISKAVARAGAQAVSLINTVLGMAIDVDNKRPRLKSVVGGLSGPAIKPIALRMVWEVAQAIDIPVIGIGGITSAVDALEFILAGAGAVAVGTAIFMDPQSPLKIITGIEDYLIKHGISRVSDLVGALELHSNLNNKLT